MLSHIRVSKNFHTSEVQTKWLVKRSGILLKVQIIFCWRFDNVMRAPIWKIDWTIFWASTRWTKQNRTHTKVSSPKLHSLQTRHWSSINFVSIIWIETLVMQSNLQLRIAQFFRKSLDICTSRFFLTFDAQKFFCFEEKMPIWTIDRSVKDVVKCLLTNIRSFEISKIFVLSVFWFT